MRPDGRQADELRPFTFQRDFTEMAAGSVLASFGRTQLLCTASVDDDVPRWMRGSKKGWVTAEYSMLPGSTPGRANREAARGRQSGRTQEIQRLIGRALRSVVDMGKLGERQIILDCDVIQADGGTRTASITGAWVALNIACQSLLDAKKIEQHPVTDQIAAVSCGIVDGTCRLDLEYVEDSAAQADANFLSVRRDYFQEIDLMTAQPVLVEAVVLCQ